MHRRAGPVRCSPSGKEGAVHGRSTGIEYTLAQSRQIVVDRDRRSAATARIFLCLECLFRLRTRGTGGHIPYGRSKGNREGIHQKGEIGMQPIARFAGDRDEFHVARIRLS